MPRRGALQSMWFRMPPASDECAPALRDGPTGFSRPTIAPRFVRIARVVGPLTDRLATTDIVPHGHGYSQRSARVKSSAPIRRAPPAPRPAERPRRRARGHQPGRARTRGRAHRAAPVSPSRRGRAPRPERPRFRATAGGRGAVESTAPRIVWNESPRPLAGRATALRSRKWPPGPDSRSPAGGHRGRRPPEHSAEARRAFG